MKCIPSSCLRHFVFCPSSCPWASLSLQQFSGPSNIGYFATLWMALSANALSPFPPTPQTPPVRPPKNPFSLKLFTSPFGWQWNLNLKKRTYKFHANWNFIFWGITILAFWSSASHLGGLYHGWGGGWDIAPQAVCRCWWVERRTWRGQPAVLFLLWRTTTVCYVTLSLTPSGLNLCQIVKTVHET